jgi:NAD(P)H-hydrate epimerase
MEIEKNILKKVFRERKKDSRKGDFGHLLVIGGSKLYHGSIAFNALAAYRTGADLVTVLAPERAANIVASFSPDLITYPLKGDFIKPSHLKILFKFSERKDAIVIGGGAERRKETLSTIRSFLKKIKIPCVIDADAIYAVAKSKNVLKNIFVITPHSYEFFVLSGTDVKKMSIKEKINEVKKIANSLGCTILLKGSIDIISDGYRVAINRTGNPYMTKGGTGDTLAGICGSLLAQGNEPFYSACAAAYINGKAGDIAARDLKHSLTASDLLDYIPKVWNNKR